MQIFINILENTAVVLITIVALAAGGWLMLMILQWGLKLKSGSREQDGLVDLWQSAMTRKPPTGKEEAPEDE